MKIHNIEQNTDEWFEVRKGKFTASTFKDLFSKPTTVAYEKAIYKPVFERLTGDSPESFSNEWMQRGHELEDSAKMQYELSTGNKVENIGFVELNEWVGCSPDGFVGEDGLIEIKCPAFNTHMNYLLNKKLPSSYKWQVYGQLWVTGRNWCDFMSYYPGLPEFIIRVKWDDKMISQLSIQVDESIKNAEEIYNKLK